MRINYRFISILILDLAILATFLIGLPHESSRFHRYVYHLQTHLEPFSVLSSYVILPAFLFLACGGGGSLRFSWCGGGGAAAAVCVRA